MTGSCPITHLFISSKIAFGLRDKIESSLSNGALEAGEEEALPPPPFSFGGRIGIPRRNHSAFASFIISTERGEGFCKPFSPTNCVAAASFFWR